MELIYLLQFNNYYNRKATAPIGFEYLSDHHEQIVYYGRHNFVPGDGVDTELILNISDDLVCNYLIVAKDDGSEIKSHWFVIESIRTRTGQYRLVLHRDLVADAYYDLLDSPMFVEKATLNYDDPFIYNDEAMTFNQIKNLEFPLKDSTEKKWIVGYMGRTGEIHVDQPYNAAADINASQYSHTEWLQDHPNISTLNDVTIEARISSTQDPNTFNYVTFTKNGTLQVLRLPNVGEAVHVLTVDEANQLAYSNFHTYFNFTFIDSSIRILENYSSADNLSIYNNKTIVFNDGIYRIHTSISTNSTALKLITANTGELALNLNNYMENAANAIGITTFYKDNKAFSYVANYNTISISLEFISDADVENIKFDILETRQHLQDAPYDMFFMEHNDKNMQIAQLIMLVGATNVYDVQLLPYCPSISIYNAVHDVTDNDYVEVKKGSTHFSEIYFSNKSTDTVEINFGVTPNPARYKIENLTQVHRIVSPNYNGIFEFSPYKNKGVDKFYADFTYKPYQPYIHVYPRFKGLYGGNFKDARGLICGGDFSLPRVNDAFNAYEVQNKYYQQIFDRNIQTMELQNKFAQLGDVTGAFSGTLQGAAAGALMGGVYGAVAGGVVSAVGGVADVAINRTLRNDAMDLTKDQFGYTLGNIRALPQSISKTTAFTANNKYWPFLEVYGCTNEETRALENKLKWNGMTVMRIGTLNEFLRDEESYIKGKLIRLDSNNYDNHFTVSLANELNQGIYIKREV